MPKKDPRDKGLTGEARIRNRYHYLLEHGVPSDIAKSARKRKWDVIEETIKMVKSGMAKNISVPKYYATSQTKARKAGKPEPPKKKPAAKKKPVKKTPAAKKKKTAAKKTKNQIPKGYSKPPAGKYYAKNHKTGEYFLKSFPQKKEIPVSDCYPRMQVFYEEVVETPDGEAISSHLRKMNNRSVKYLRAEINGGKGTGWMNQDGVYVGRVRIEIAETKEQMESNLSKYSGWTVLYNDCPDPKKLLAVIAVLGKYVYEIDRKEDAVNTLISTAEVLDPQAGSELNNLIG